MSQPYPLLVIPVRAVNNRIGYNWENRVSGLPKALIWPVISTRALPGTVNQIVGPIIYVITYCFSKSRDLSQSQIEKHARTARRRI